MTIDSKTIITEDDVNRISLVQREFLKNWAKLFFKDHRPKFMLIDLVSSPVLDLTDDEMIDVVAARILKRYKPAFEELAKQVRVLPLRRL